MLCVKARWSIQSQARSLWSPSLRHRLLMRERRPLWRPAFHARVSANTVAPRWPRCGLLAAKSCAARTQFTAASHPDLSVFAVIRARVRGGGRDHLDRADNLPRPVPELGVVRRDGEQADIRIVGRIPPRLYGRRPQLLDLRLVLRHR